MYEGSNLEKYTDFTCESHFPGIESLPAINLLLKDWAVWRGVKQAGWKQNYL